MAQQGDVSQLLDALRSPHNETRAQAEKSFHVAVQAQPQQVRAKSRRLTLRSALHPRTKARAGAGRGAMGPATGAAPR